MAVIAEVTLRGITREQYDAVRERAGRLEQAPDGLVAHLTWWEGEDCHNLDGWESEAAFDAFARAAAGPGDGGARHRRGARGDLPPGARDLHAAGRRRRRHRHPERRRDDQRGPGRGGYAAFAAGDIPARARAVRRRPRVDHPRQRRASAGCTAGRREPASSSHAVAELRGAAGGARALHRRGRHRRRPGAAPRAHGPAASTSTSRGCTCGRCAAARSRRSRSRWTRRRSSRALEGGPGDVEAHPAPDVRRAHQRGPTGGRRRAVRRGLRRPRSDGRHVGAGRFKQMVAQWRDAVPDVHCEVDTVIAQGDLCAWLVRTTGTHTGDALGFPATGQAIRDGQRQHRPVPRRPGRRALGRAGDVPDADPDRRHPDGRAGRAQSARLDVGQHRRLGQPHLGVRRSS